MVQAVSSRALAQKPMRQFRESIKGLTKPAYYTLPPTVVPAITGANPGVATARVTIDSDAQFYAVHLMGLYQIVHPVSGFLLDTFEELHAPPTVQFQTGTSSQRMFENPMLWSNAIGTAKLPARRSRPYPLTAGSTIVAEYQNFETIALTVTITFGGLKVYVSQPR